MNYKRGVCEGIFKNGDIWTGTGFTEEEELERCESDMVWFEAIDKKTQLPYITREEPERIPLFTLIRVPGVWTELDKKGFV